MGEGGSEEQDGSLAYIDYIAMTYTQTGGPVPKPEKSLSGVWASGLGFQSLQQPEQRSVRGKGGKVQSGDVLAASKA